MGQRRGTAVLLLAVGHLAGLLASGTACANVYQGFSDYVLKLGENMATYNEVDGIELQGLHRVCGYWDEFHTCALTALWECQKEAAAVWEMLRRESRKIKFQGSLFDLCSPSMAQSFAWTHVPNASVLGIPLVITWLNLQTAALSTLQIFDLDTENKMGTSTTGICEVEGTVYVLSKAEGSPYCTVLAFLP